MIYCDGTHSTFICRISLKRIPVKVSRRCFMSLSVNPFSFSRSIILLRFASDVGPRHPQHSRPLLGQTAWQPPLVTGPKHILPSSRRHLFPLDLHSTQTGLS